MNSGEFYRKAANLVKWVFVPGEYEGFSPEDITAIRKRKRLFVLAGATVVFISLTALTVRFQEPTIGGGFYGGLAAALVLNLLAMLLVVLLILVGRNVVKLYFEGSKFQTRLVVAFISLTFIPTILMFAVASELLSDTVDRWINLKIERTLSQSLQVAEGMYNNTQDEMKAKASFLADLVHSRELLKPGQRNNLTALLRQKIREYNADMVQVYNADFELTALATGPNKEFFFYDLRSKQEQLAKVAVGEPVSYVEDTKGKNMAISIIPIAAGNGQESTQGAVVVVRLVSRSMIEKVHDIVTTFQDYKQLALRKEMIKFSYQITLLLVAGVVVFSAIWFGMYIAKGITVPLELLSEATVEVAKGNLDVRIDLPTKDDEVGKLVKAFNVMTLDLRNFKEQIESKNRELSGSNIELFRWGKYIEAVLENVGGVISIDRTGIITTINDAAARIFGVDPEMAKGKNYKKALSAAYLEPIRKVIRDMTGSGSNKIEREILFSHDGRRKILKTNVSVLQDHDGLYMGMVFVFDDVTDLVAAQRTMAWREMARQIAHEIKNPLTPIQLNAQRMRRKFSQQAPDFPKVLDDATNVIIQEVDQLKALVDRFSRYAKQTEVDLSDRNFPAEEEMGAKRELADLHAIINDVVKLYEDTNPGVELQTQLDPLVTPVRIDTEQMRRALINLVENAFVSVNGHGRITLRTRAMPGQGKIALELEDTGSGVNPGIKEKIFMPYFSTKENGTGLGLAIVSRVVEDHGGRIYVRDNKPMGAVFTIELSTV
ncbi:MAG: ATP-binding protein [Nitrospinota bacterium]|nr:ATP-binding protein [Nitrospinota bacterium]MDH5677113.1 ATP-binding protein [Nitrospinota bacterium]MDH5756947.1 ATP-binding protein [Nitrospinota bacterium]